MAYEVAVWLFIDNRYAVVANKLSEAAANAERDRRMAEIEARSGIVPDMTRVIVRGEPNEAPSGEIERSPRHYDSQGYCDNPARGY